jgi:hypothetical protein
MPNLLDKMLNKMNNEAKTMSILEFIIFKIKTKFGKRVLFIILLFLYFLHTSTQFFESG